MPIVHLGVEVYGWEFFFGAEKGIMACEPGTFDSHRHMDTLEVGHTTRPSEDVRRHLVKLKERYPMEAYRVPGCNCQTFAAELCGYLGVEEGAIPPEFLAFAGEKVKLPVRSERCTTLCDLPWNVWLVQLW